MIAGERTERSNKSYKFDPLYAFAKAYTECASNILATESLDIFSEPQKAVRPNNTAVVEALREFFVNDFVNESDSTKSPEEIDDELNDVNEMWLNDLQAMRENTVQQDYSPMVGLAAPIHKLILMNNVFSQGNAIQKVVAVKPSFTISLERRLLIKPDGTEIDMWLQQNEIGDAIDNTAPTTVFDLAVPHQENDTDFIGQLGGTTLDKLSMETHIVGIYVENVYFAEGDHLPDADGYYTNKGEIATAADAGLKNVWFKVNLSFAPTYGGPNRLDRALNYPVTITYKKNAEGEVDTITDTIFASMNNNKITVTSVKGTIQKVRLATRLDTSNAMQEECSVEWRVDTDYAEIPDSKPINTTVSPNEMKDVSAYYDANQVTKIISLTKTAMSEWKDKKIYKYLDDAWRRGDERNSFIDEFDFAVPEGYALDWVTFRQATFLDMFDDYVTRMLQVLNDPNMTVTIYGDPRIIRKLTPTEYTYQAPSNIGPVKLDYTQTIVDTKDGRVYNFLGSDKMRNKDELLILLNPHNSDRICFRIYDYQLYISNEIRNTANPALPAIHAFDRFLMYSMFEITGKINILNPSGQRGKDVIR